MATAYEVMAMAKRQGAEVEAEENYYDYLKKVRKEEARASKAGMLGKIGGGIGGSIASFLAPAALTALSLGTGGIGSMLLAGALGTGISRGGTEIGDFLARQWTMGGKGRGKGFKDIGKMKGVSGPYGQRRASELQRAGRQSMEEQRNTIAEMLDVENINRWLSSAMSGLSAAGKARAGAETLKGMGDATLVDKLKAGIEGGVGEGYKLGAKDTGDWLQQKVYDIGNLKNVKGNKALMDLITTTEGVAPDTTDMNVEMSKLLYDPSTANVPYKDISGIDQITGDVGFAPLTDSEIPSIAATMPTSAAPSSIPPSLGRWQGGMTPYSAYDFLLPEQKGGELDTMSMLQNLIEPYQRAPFRSEMRSIGAPRKSLTLLQQLLQGGR